MDPELKALRDEYAGRLPMLIDAIELVWQRFIKDNDGRTLRTLHQLCHKLAGSSGAYGYPELHRVTKAIADILLSKEALSPEQTSRIASLVESMEEAAKVVASEEWFVGQPAENEGKEAPLVYVVDDDEDLLKQLASQLKGARFKVSCFSTIRSFKDACFQELPQVVLMDLMHDQEADAGVDAVRRVSNQFDVFPPVVFMSARSDFRARMSSVQIGAERYFVKPLDYDRLITTLNALTGRHDSSVPRVLIVEDDMQQARLYSEHLHAAGIEAEILKDVIELPRMLNEFSPDMILLDLYMPGFDGLNVARLIRQDDQWAQVPIVFLSAETDGDRQRDALAAGGDSFLTKPIDPDTLVDEVTARVKRSRWVNHLSRDSSELLMTRARQLYAIDQHNIVLGLDEDFLITEYNSKIRSMITEPDQPQIRKPLIGSSFFGLIEVRESEVRAQVTKGLTWRGLARLQPGLQPRLQQEGKVPPKTDDFICSLVPWTDQFGRPRGYTFVGTEIIKP